MLKLVFIVAVATAGAAAAQDIDTKAARTALFAPVTAEVEILQTANLPKDQATALELVGGQQLYYGAIAISPADGLMSAATVAAANYHDTDAASKAALDECNAKKTGAADCVIAALIRPKRWKDTGFQLSSDATAAVAADAFGALAASRSTGSWGIGTDGAAAVQDCKARNDQAQDCVVVIAN